MTLEKKGNEPSALELPKPKPWHGPEPEFDLGEETVPVSTTWSELKLKGPQMLRDLWRQQDLGKQADGCTAEIPRHGVMLIRVSPRK